MDEILVIIAQLAVVGIILFLCWCVGRFAENRGGSFWFGFIGSLFLSPILCFFIVFLITSGNRATPQITTSMTSEDFVRIEQIKLERRRTELRWRLVTNLIFLTLIVGGAYFIYHHPGPLRPLRDNIFGISPANQSAPSPNEDNGSPAAAPQRIPMTLPRDVILTRDMTIRVPDGVVGVRKGQIVRLLSKNEEKYSAQYAGANFTVLDADFKEK